MALWATKSVRRRINNNNTDVFERRGRPGQWINYRKEAKAAKKCGQRKKGWMRRKIHRFGIKREYNPLTFIYDVRNMKKFRVERRKSDARFFFSRHFFFSSRPLEALWQKCRRRLLRWCYTIEHWRIVRHEFRHEQANFATKRVRYENRDETKVRTVSEHWAFVTNNADEHSISTV